MNLTGLDGSARECEMALNIISQRIGGFRIIGLVDETADEMDRQARELWNQCGTGKNYGSMVSMTYFKVDEFNHIIPLMYFTDPTVAVLGAGVDVSALVVSAWENFLGVFPFYVLFLGVNRVSFFVLFNRVLCFELLYVGLYSIEM